MNREKAVFKTYGFIEHEKLTNCIKTSKITDALRYQSLDNIYFGLCHEKMKNPNFRFEKWGIRYMGLQKAIGCNYIQLFSFETCTGNE